MNNIFDNDNIRVSPIVVARDKIENLTDRPNNARAFGGDGMTALELKQSFDKIGIYVATRLNNLTEALKTAEAGASIGISGWDNELTNMRDMLFELTESSGASRIGTGTVVGGVNANLQAVVDDIYRLISSYELDDIYDIKLDLQYEKATGACGKLDSMDTDITELQTFMTAIKTMLDIGASGNASVRLDQIEEDIEELVDSKNSALGLATLDGSGKLYNSIDASKISSGVLPLSCIPDAAYERTKLVSNASEMLELDISDVQNGDIVVVQEQEEKWYKVVDDSQLGSMGAFRLITGGRTAVSQMALEYDPNYDGGNSIASEFISVNSSISSLSSTISSLSATVNTNNANVQSSIQTINNDISTVETTLNNKVALSTKVTAVLNASNWNEVDGVYEYSITVPGVTATSNQEVMLPINATLEEYEMVAKAKIVDGGQSANLLKLKAYGEVPTEDINVVIILRKDL